jgi:hypothetical protein
VTYLADIKANWTYITGVGAVVAVAVGWILTYLGWRQSFEANLALERQKFISSRDLD